MCAFDKLDCDAARTVIAFDKLDCDAARTVI
jgi:hypothetical protein